MNITGVGCPPLYNYANGKPDPQNIHVTNTPLSLFFQRYLLQKAMSVFKFTLPENWSREYFLYTLYCWGFLSVVRTDKFGVIPQGCGLQGYDVFYRPTNAVISNPLLRGIMTPRIGKQCTIIRLQPDYGGIMDLVTFYADMMALCAQTAGVNLVNSKLSYVFAAKNRAAAQSFKKLYDNVASGEPMTVVDKELFNADGTPAWQAFEQNVGQNYIAGQIIDDIRKWEQRYDTAIGIPTANTEKRERLIVDEVNSNNVETVTLCSSWLEELKRCFDKTSKMFDVELSVDWRVNPLESTKGGGANGFDS